MERKGLGGEDEIYNEPNESETQPLVPRPPEPPAAYEKFLAGRERQQPKRWIIPAQFALKVSFWSLGMWGHRVWKYFAQTFLVIAAIIFFVFSVILIAYSRDPSQFCPPDSNFSLCCYRFTVAVLFTTTIPLCLAFIVCHIVGKSSTSALVCPPQFLIKETHKAVIFMSFLAFLAMNASFSVNVYTVSVLNYTNIGSNASSTHNDSLPWSAKGFMVLPAAEFLFSWFLLNICHVFAAICIVLGTFAEDTFRLIRDPQNRTLDDVIRIHEDFCNVVFSTASVYSVWFLLHLITYSVGHILLSTKFFLDINRPLSEFNMGLIFNGLQLLFLFYIFVTPFIFAARISSDCAGITVIDTMTLFHNYDVILSIQTPLEVPQGEKYLNEIYEKVNCSTSDDWNEGHPFKDRNNISLFVSYAKKRRCGFRVGRITFGDSLAWVSFLVGVTGVLLPLIQDGIST